MSNSIKHIFAIYGLPLSFCQLKCVLARYACPIVLYRYIYLASIFPMELDVPNLKQVSYGTLFLNNLN